MTRVLVVDDEPDLVWGVRHALLDEGYEVHAAHDGVAALESARQQRPDLVVLDVMMPKLDGIGLCRELRRDPSLASVPVLFLTVRHTVEDKIKGLDEGGDDYLCKPFELGELKARARALLRRVGGANLSTPDGSRVLSAGLLRLDLRARTLEVDGQPVPITPAELKLLSFLMAHPGQVFSSRQLLERVWGYPPHTSDPGLVRWHVKNLREKIERDPANAAYIRTMARHGYMFERRQNASSR
ncbi:MAG: response regulator transcription factor [Thermoleophilia bacterium]|nr:response regulator transcription factor [Thermoleophilia bacterium]